MLQDTDLLSKIGSITAENEPSFAEGNGWNLAGHGTQEKALEVEAKDRALAEVDRDRANPVGCKFVDCRSAR